MDELIESIQRRLELFEQAASAAHGVKVAADLTIHSGRMYVHATGSAGYLFGYGKTPDECFADAYRKLEEVEQKRRAELTDLARTLGIEEAA